MPATPVPGPTASLRFRPMTEADLEAVEAIEQDVQRFPWGRGQFGGALDAGYTAWVFEEILGGADAKPDPASGAGSHPLASAASGTPCGYAILMGVLDEWELLTLAIARSHQGRGLGRQALKGLLDHARQQGVACVFLEVATGNAPARALYEHTGFVIVGERKGYYRSRDGRTDDALVMRLDLASLQDTDDEAA